MIVLAFVNILAGYYLAYRTGKQKVVNDLAKRLVDAGKDIENLTIVVGCLKEQLKELRKSGLLSVNGELPEVDKEVIVLSEEGKIGFGHIVDKSVAKYFDGWNIPDVAFWMPFKQTEEMKEFYED